MRSALDDWRETSVQPRGVDPGATARAWAVARLVSLDTGRGTATVSIHGSQPVELPCLPGDYSNVQTVYVQLDPLRSGSGQLVLGPGALQGEIAPSPVVVAPSTLRVETTILPTWSGTWQGGTNKYGTWQPLLNGGTSTLYQGVAYGSGQLVGLAVYGEQVLALGASRILEMTVEVVRATSELGTPVLQGSPHNVPPAGNPTRVGPTASGLGQVDLVASGIAERLRTGAARALALVGADYVGVRGTSLATGMALRIRYERPN